MKASTIRFGSLKGEGFFFFKERKKGVKERKEEEEKEGERMEMLLYSKKNGY